jgi:hypothetical protein
MGALQRAKNRREVLDAGQIDLAPPAREMQSHGDGHGRAYSVTATLIERSARCERS